MTEHAYMRKSQSYEVQFGLAQQIVEASKLLIDMLAELAQHVNVNFSYISGNHDRASGDKDHLLEGDSVMTVIGFTVEQFIKMSQSERMSMGTYDDSYPFSISKEIN
ncbi:hypothetical protein, partial [Mycobacterium tuberculosis]|uniref:hypothetical protein n=1 Tax=Mycobacterium tuberculosis TaxID=1773 RepID=UPI001BE05CCE